MSEHRRRSRAAVAVFSLGLATLLPLGGGAPAVAAPGSGASAADPDRPVRVTLTELTPPSSAPGAEIVLSGELTNDGDQTLTEVTLRLQRGALISTRTALTQELASPSSATADSAPFRQLPGEGELRPGQTVAFRYVTTTDELGLDTAGVYPALVNVNGTGPGGLTQRVGELSTQLVLGPTESTARTAVAFLWPITDRPHRGADGDFTDDDLAQEVATGGRLDRALAAVERLPRAPGSTAPAVPVTLAVDPALVQELTSMAAGSYRVRADDGDGTAGTGSADAGKYLSRLRAVAAEQSVLALPYADADLDALQSAGGSDAVRRTLPQATAGDGPGTGTGTGDDATPAGATEQGADGTTAPQDGGQGPSDEPADGSGAEILRSALGVDPRTDLNWPVDGTVQADTLATLQQAGVDRLVLSEASYDSPAAAVADRGSSAAARVAVQTPDGPLSTFVADTGLGDAVAALGSATAGPVLSRQQYLAELAVLTTQLAAAGGTSQTVLVVPPRLVDVDAAAATTLMSDAAQLPWLQAVSLDQLADGPTAQAGELRTGTDAAALSGPGLDDVRAALGLREHLASAVVENPGRALAGYDAAIARSTAASWRDDPEGFRSAAAAARARLMAVSQQVTLLEPADGTYSLASSDAPLVLTVSNDLPFAVDVRLQLRALGSVGLTTGDVGLQRIDPGTRRTVRVPTTVRQSGGFAVTATVSTPDGGPLGEQVDMQVKSTAYGTITLVITLGAGALLGLLFLRRLVLFVLRRRRRGGPDDDLSGTGGPGDGGPDGRAPADDPVDPSWHPPTRSPV